MKRKQCIPAEEFLGKIKAAHDEKVFKDSVIFRRVCDRIMESGQSWDSIPDAHDSRDLFLTMGMKEWREKEPLYQ